MKNHWILSTVLALVATPFAASAQVNALSKDGGPTSASSLMTGVPDRAAAELVNVLAIPTPVPLGPSDLLNEYEQAMASTAEGFNAEVNRIAQAVQQKQITEDEGEYLCKEAYQLAMMQFQVLSGLHDMLEEEITQTPESSRPANPAPAAGLNDSGYHDNIPHS